MGVFGWPSPAAAPFVHLHDNDADPPPERGDMRHFLQALAGYGSDLHKVRAPRTFRRPGAYHPSLTAQTGGWASNLDAHAPTIAILDDDRRVGVAHAPSWAGPSPTQEKTPFV
jgi:hypothetical protein